MAIIRPTLEQLQALASRLHMQLTPEQASEYLALMQQASTPMTWSTNCQTSSPWCATSALRVIDPPAGRTRLMPGTTVPR